MDVQRQHVQRQHKQKVSINTCFNYTRVQLRIYTILDKASGETFDFINGKFDFTEVSTSHVIYHSLSVPTER